ncbi:MAG: hypothetical protein MJ067_05375 [Oscillospiraceae bacterium]|nr:hypothetical protein [Oscillospiraceae bacterium]
MYGINEWLRLLAAVLAGISACIPLAVKLCAYVKKARSESDRACIARLLLAPMKDAEKLFISGEERKEYVLGAIASLAETLGLELETKAVSDMIDELCEFAKTVNAG